MSNRNELKKARRAAEYATSMLEQIEALPRRVGSLIQWGEPGERGLIWRREGDDQWSPLHDTYGYEAQPETFGVFQSAHVASVAETWRGWHRIKQLPTVPASSSTGDEQ